MDNQPSSPASAPVTPAGTAYVPPTPPNQTTPPTPPTPPATPPTTQQNNPPSNTMPPKSRSKMPLIIMGLVVLLLLAGGGYYFMNMQQPKPVMQKKVMVKPSPTLMPKDELVASPAAAPGWKTYTNTIYGFSLEYPSDELPLATENLLPISTLYPKPVANTNIQGPNMIMDIAVATSPAHLTIKNALGEGPGLNYDYSLINNNNKNFTKFTIDEVDAIRSDGINVPEKSPTITDVIFFKDNSIYEISFYPVNAHNTEVFNKILSTFKFAQ